MPPPSRQPARLVTTADASDSRPVPDRFLDLHDSDRNGRVTRSEYSRGDMFFTNLDKDGDGAITRDDFKQPVTMPPDLAAPFLIVRRFGSPDDDSIAIGDLEEAFERVDLDHDGAIDRAEFSGGAPHGGPDRFDPLLAVADQNLDRRLTLAELRGYALARDRDDDGRISRRERMRRGTEPPIGWFDAADRLPAPDFVLPLEDGSGRLALTDFRHKQPVVLIFGSFT